MILIKSKLGLLNELYKKDFIKNPSKKIYYLGWSIIEPLALLFVYMIFFGLIFKGRWGFNISDPYTYGLVIFSGLIIYNLYVHSVQAFPTIITNNKNYVKKVVFPLEILVFVPIFTAVTNALISLFILTFCHYILIGNISYTILLSPLIVIIMIPMLAGIGYVLSIFGTLYNDLGRLVNLTNQVILFLTPIFYNLDSAPDLLKSLINIIPLTYLIEQFRLVTLYETIPSFKGLAMFVILELIFFYLAFLFFQKYRSELANIV